MASLPAIKLYYTGHAYCSISIEGIELPVQDDRTALSIVQVILHFYSSGQ